MNRLFNIKGTIVLVGILVKLSFVFWFLFDKLDDGHIVGKITGITFAFASVWFVVKGRSQWLKTTMVLLDVCTILYYYLHEYFEVPKEYASIIAAAYSGLIIFHLGKMVNEQMRNGTQSDAERIRELEEQLRAVTETQHYETERKRILRRIKEAKNEKIRQKYELELTELDEMYKQ